MTKPKTKTPDPAVEPVKIYPTRMIPLNLLDVDEANVRQIKNGITIEMLADDIAHRSLIQSLNVRTASDADGKPTGRFGVKAGGRRLKALQILVKRKYIEPDQPIPCIVKDDGNAADDSLAENVFREQLHPLDQFKAFKTLADQNIPDATIAKRYHVTERFVQQRLKLAKASPKLLKAFQDEAISLEQLQAFCVTDDHKRQESILKLIKEGQHYTAYNIRNVLTEESIEATDPRARFVGLEAYKAAGGTLMHDLFKENSGPWLENPALLNDLAQAKIETVRNDILALGFKWAEITLEPRDVWNLKRNLAEIPNLPSSLSKEEKAEQNKLSAEYDQILDDIENTGDEPSAAKQKRLDELHATLLEMQNRAPRMSPKQIARSGVIISVDDDGDLCIEYGFLKPEDVKQKKAAAKSARTMDGEPDADSEIDEDDDDTSDYVRADNNPGAIVAAKPLSDSLVRDLTSYRTIALQNEVGLCFPTAFLAALHALCAGIFCRQSFRTCAKIAPSQQYFRGVQGLEDWQPYKDIQTRHDQWADRLPEDADALWNALALLTDQERGELFAHCVSLTLDAVHGNQSRSSSALHSDQLAEAVQLDMTQAGWISTAANYFSRINKEQIIEAVKEAVPAKAALIDHLKKGVMAAEAERIIKDTDWLPPLLRASFATLPEPETATSAEDNTAPSIPAESKTTEIPAFLKGGLNGASPPPAV